MSSRPSGAATPVTSSASASAATSGPAGSLASRTPSIRHVPASSSARNIPTVVQAERNAASYASIASPGTVTCSVSSRVAWRAISKKESKAGLCPDPPHA